MSTFPSDLLKRLEVFFEPDELETQMRAFEDIGPAENPNPAGIKVIHRPTGQEVVCEDYDSQTQNKAMALVELLARLGTKQPAK